MFELSIEQLIIALGYIGIFGMMIANGAFTLPSSQILYIIAGFFVSTGRLELMLVVAAGALGNTLGNIILYELTRRRGLHYITRFKIFPEREVQKVQIVFTRRGSWFVFIGKLLPAIKVFIPIVAGIGKMNRLLFGILMLIASIIWALIFIAIGFVFGENTELFGFYPIVLFIVAGFVLWIFYRYMNSPDIIKELEKQKEQA